MMTSTAQWLHFKLGIPLVEDGSAIAPSADEAQTAEADLIALQKSVASLPLTVTFVGRGDRA
jgi:hypothetical protein